MGAKSPAEKALLDALLASPLPGWDLTPQFRFEPERRWTFDFAFPSQKLAVEVDGKHHLKTSRQIRDCEKLNEATRQGWRILRFPGSQMKRAAEWAALIVECLCFTASGE